VWGGGWRRRTGRGGLQDIPKSPIRITETSLREIQNPGGGEQQHGLRIGIREHVLTNPGGRLEKWEKKTFSRKRVSKRKKDVNERGFNSTWRSLMKITIWGGVDSSTDLTT